MRKKVKAVLLGLTNSGKSTVADILKNKGWPVLEVDDEAQAKNQGIWPEDENVLDRLFKETNKEVLRKNDVIFVTSYLEISDIKKFIKSGFKILELHASYDELIRRKIGRDGVPKDKYERFIRNYNNYKNIIAKTGRYIELSLDTTGVKSEAIADKIEQLLIS